MLILRSILGLGFFLIPASIFESSELLIFANLASKSSSLNETHYEVGKEIRNTIKKLGGTMPENLPTPSKSLKELEKGRKIESKQHHD